MSDHIPQVQQYDSLLREFRRDEHVCGEKEVAVFLTEHERHVVRDAIVLLEACRGPETVTLRSAREKLEQKGR